MPNDNLTAAEVRELGTVQRIPYVKRIKVTYPRWDDILKQLSLVHELSLISNEPQCCCLVGPLGTGKTTLIKVYVARYPVVITSTGKLQRIIRAVIPGKATVKNMYRSILHELGDPLADKGTIGNMEYRIRRYLRDLGVEFIFFDEIQHFVDRDRHVILMDATDCLKTLLKEAKIGCAFVGVDGEVQKVLAANAQLASLFGGTIRLHPFTWNEAKPDTVKEFRAVLAQTEELLPLNEPSGLSDIETAWRCFVASGGITRLLMKLIQGATVLALKQGYEHLDYRLLAQAFNGFVAAAHAGLPNPFEGDRPTLPPPHITSPENNSSIPKGTNNRSWQRKPPQETLNDVLS